MSDSIDPRLEWMIWGDITTQADIDNRNQLAAELSRQLLPLDARERIARWIGDWEYAMSWGDLTSDERESSFRAADSLLADLSANGSDVATSPEAAAECPECGGKGLLVHVSMGSRYICPTCNGTGKVAW